MEWTTEQKQVITLRDRNILVSAAAGSGKTAVLVERIIGRILDQKHPVDIDRMLVVTFTSAAAAQMRERIGAAIEKALEEDPSNSHLMKQASLVHHAQITTIHSFCLHLIRNYFHKADLEPNFRIAEEGELNLLQEDVLADVFVQKYEQAQASFLQFVESFATGKKDDRLKEMTFTLYRFAMSYPWPKEWLLEALGNYRFETFDQMEDMPWMASLLAYLEQICADLLKEADANRTLSAEEDGPLYLNATAEQDYSELFRLTEAKRYRAFASALSSISFGRLPSKRGYQGSEEKLERFKERREEIKKAVKGIKEKFFFSGEDELLQRLRAMAPAAEELVDITLAFMEAYDAKKREKNILDFNDLEHFALKILLDEKTKEPSEAALALRNHYEEVMIDEYQDSNLVQESLMHAVSRESEGVCNRFMVGDVKQSIYRFRLARPELFLEKYDRYTTEASGMQKIELHKNFRSRAETIAFINRIFFQIMKKDLGNIAYDEAAALHPGAAYPESGGMEPEVLLADAKDELLEEAGLSDPIELEAELVAARIRRMMRTQNVTDAVTKKLRKIRYSDIVILLRSFGNYADTFLSVLERKKIPAHASSKTGYFQATEIQTALAFLKILDNPRQDIPLAATLRSLIGGFTDEELAGLKAAQPKRAFHCCVLEPEWETLSEALSEKLKKFLELLSHFRDLSTELSIHALLYRILEETGYARRVAAMPGGTRRKANLEMLLEKALAYEKTSYRGLFHFIRYMDRLQKYNVDYGEAELVSENANVVRIMTIHKSKGLEFPVVFLCGTAKRFHHADERKQMLLHPKLGVALDYVDPTLRVRGATLCKRVVAKQLALENQGEELRVLYVAMTRAMEKLVISGVEKDIGEKVRKLSEDQAGGGTGLSFLKRVKADSFLDLILPAVIAAQDGPCIQEWGVKDLVGEEVESRLVREEGISALLHQKERPGETEDAYVAAQLSYRYPDFRETNRKTKYSVSELKSRTAGAFYEAQELLEGAVAEETVVPYLPRFAGGEAQKSQGAFYGSAMHRAVECLPVERLAGEDGLAALLPLHLDRLTGQGRLSEEMRALIRMDKLLAFYRSNLALRMRAAAEKGALHRERPFVMGRAADAILGDGSKTMVLIQGMIDAWFVEDDGIVLLDYKTDAISEEDELTRRYAGQLGLYQEALEGSLSKKVKEKLIYSFYLDRAVAVLDV